MKTIEVTDEMYDKLMALATEMTTQDPRGTRMPHIFQIRTVEEVVAADGCGEEFWFDEEDVKLHDDEDIKEAVINIKGWDSLEKEDADKLYNELDGGDIEDILENHDYKKVNIQEEYRYQNFFFTAKACKEHIKLNDYHYRQPVDYLSHAWRNPEMELVATFLCGLVGKPMHT